MNKWLLLRLSPLAVLLIFGFCFGDDVDRACIAAGLVFALSMAGGVPTYSKQGENLDA